MYYTLFIIFIIFSISAGFQILLNWTVYSQIAFRRKKSEYNSNLPPVSVVITARNEHHNLLHNLKPILEQDYPLFEVVVVNDQSSDDSEFYLKSIESQYQNLKIVNIKNPINFFKGKKFPLSIGIKSATYDLLLLTDADCKPASDKWIQEMVVPYQNEEVQIVLGYGGYAYRKGLLNFLIRFETIKIALQYLSFAKIGIPYMGVGRNLSYKRSLFYQQHGFQSHYKIQSGDDDLFVNKASNSKNISVVFSPDAKTISTPKTKFSSWWNQKRRHLSSGIKYKKSHILLLSFIDLSYIIFIVTSIILFSFEYQLLAVLSIFITRFLSFLVIFKKAMIKFGEQKLLLISPLMELFLSFIIPMITITNLLFSAKKWK